MPVPLISTSNNINNNQLVLPLSRPLPPSFGTREQWINSLPTWRRTKRRIWEDDSRVAEQGEQVDDSSMMNINHSLLEQEQYHQGFTTGLAHADNASAIKGARAHACIPPMNALLQSVGLAPEEPFATQEIGDDEQDDDDMRYSDGSCADRNEDMDIEYSHSQLGNDESQEELLYERGAFTPIFEDDSPELSNLRDPSSSPIEPVTPFGDFVDRAVASSANCGHYDDAYSPLSQNEQRYPVYEAQVPEAAASDLVVTPCATTAYKRLADPLADWVTSYVWKVCTTGMTLSPAFVQTEMGVPQLYGSAPPPYLAGAVHSLLLSTLLQPSAVFLAIWYVVRLPVYFGGVVPGNENPKHQKFRAALFSGTRAGTADREAAEISAPFRLIVLGCMLANKWLDDHTFSNKTWHTISNIPMSSLNKLESLTLDIFSYDLNVSRTNWSQWLSHVMSYHMSLSSPSYPQPISRPSANPHSIVRKAIEEILQAPTVYDSGAAGPQPVFLGLDQRRKEKAEREQALAADILEIDLDEDGPLREEYLPKRRVSVAASVREPSVRHEPYHRPSASVANTHEWDRRRVPTGGKTLPPPAKWSPAGDEPILRERNRMSGHYVAVQAPVAPAPFQVLPQPVYFPQHDMGYISQNWAFNAAAAKQHPAAGGNYYDQSSVHVPSQTNYGPYPFAQPLSHSRTQSLSYDHENAQSRDRARSYSQSRYEYRASDIRMHANQLAPLASATDNAQWSQYQASMFGASYQPQWLRA